MAGIQLDVRVNQDFQRRLNVFKKEIDSKKLLKAVGEVWIGEILRTFKREGREGERWLPLADSTIARRKKGKGKHGDKILQDSGTLRLSFIRGRAHNENKLTPKFVRVGTNLDYAEYHEEGGVSKFGKPQPPQRQMLPSITVAKRKADKVLAKAIRDAARRVK